MKKDKTKLEEKSKESRKEKKGYSGRIFIGAFILIIGLLLFLKVLGVLNFGFVKELAKFWPVGIILLGIAVITRTRGVAGVLIIITVILAIYSAGSPNVYIPERIIHKQIESEPSINKINLEVKYGAGELNIESGDVDYFVDATIQTSDRDDLSIRSENLFTEKYGEEKNMILQRNADYSHFGNKRDVWNLKLSPNITYSISLDSGAAAQKINLTNINVDILNIKTGASGTEIIFGNFSTEANINAGASAIILKFPKEKSIMVTGVGGLSSFNMDGFKKEGNNYYSPNYDETQSSIKVDIQTGVSSVNAELI